MELGKLKRVVMVSAFILSLPYVWFILLGMEWPPLKDFLHGLGFKTLYPFYALTLTTPLVILSLYPSLLHPQVNIYNMARMDRNLSRITRGCCRHV
jgi:hypothetical protein